jgi:hypothetical protein
LQEHGDAVCCAVLGHSPAPTTGAKLQQLLDLKVQQWQQQQQKGQLQQGMPEVKEAAAEEGDASRQTAAPDNAAAAAVGHEGGCGSCRLLCDGASGEAVEGLAQVADGHLMHRDW